MCLVHYEGPVEGTLGLSPSRPGTWTARITGHHGHEKYITDRPSEPTGYDTLPD